MIRPNKSASEHAAQIVLGLQSLEDVTPVTSPPGQVLFYPGHVPHGAYVILAGLLVLENDRQAAGPESLRLDADAGPYVIPPPAEIDVPARYRLRVLGEARLLFIPRSLVLGSPVVRALLEGGAIAARSLQRLESIKTRPA